MAYVISDQTFRLLSDWMSGKSEIDHEEAGEDLAANARRVNNGLCYTHEDWLSVVEEAGQDEMTKRERDWLWAQLDEMEIEGAFVTDGVRDWMEDQVKQLARQIEQRRKGAGKKLRKS